MMENLIIVEGKEKYKYNRIEEIIETFVDEKYYNMLGEEKNSVLEKKVIANTMGNNIKIVKLDKYPDDYDENSFVVYDEISYILSMLKFNKFILLERTDANILGKYINKEWIEDNYIIINKFADEILKKYLEEVCNG